MLISLNNFSLRTKKRKNTGTPGQLIVKQKTHRYLTLSRLPVPVILTTGTPGQFEVRTVPVGKFATEPGQATGTG